jgi:class 3 adenylate cyclase
VSCWQEDPDKRPIFTQILTTIDKMNNHKYMSLIDNMIRRLEVNTKQLEEKVAARTNELKEEKNKVEVILSELLPQSIAEKLALGHQIDPEAFQAATLFLSDIVGFTSISALSTPMEIVYLLNAMYSMFDDIAHTFDVYNVATIGDAYMVASGLPIRNRDRHAVEICNMALVLLEAIQDFPIPHLKGEHLLMRSGIHSGPCVAGVVGIKMPRYLLFGDTVDIAARMESGEEPMKVHISEITAGLIQNQPGLNIDFRSEMVIKGKGSIGTYWLNTE